LERNHACSTEVWLVLRKASSGRQRLTLNDAVEEALCFGWIDGLLKSLDAQTYALRFTPRRKGSGWSESNLRRAERLIADGKMTPAGMAALDPKGRGAEPSPRRYAQRLAPHLERVLKDDKAAWAAFQRLPPSHQRMAVAWIMEAKGESTRERRLAEVSAGLRRGKWPASK
jgi:uncharacterized protein YdeI (YjbR/CyaY-like superfamily)